MAYQLRVAVAACFMISTANALYNRSFPEGFIFGTATSSYQIEGGWNADGKGFSSWDSITHNTPQFIADGSNGDVACDSYHRYLDDVNILTQLGVDYYRFSLSWSRILPTGHEYQVNPHGIAYYNNLINALLANNIQPMITIYHWDTPYPLQTLGSWNNPKMIEYFTNFARVAFDNFGDRVKYWITFNEPKQLCLKGSDFEYNALTTATSGIEAYLCSDTMLKAHARVYHLYDDEYRGLYGGSVGIVIDSDWFRPETDDPLDVEAAERRLLFTFGWWAHPIFSTTGNYPQVMIDRIAARSAQEGFRRSRLPTLSPADIEYIRGTADFLGLNQYTTSTTQHQEDAPIDTTPSWFEDHSTTIQRFRNFRNVTPEGELIGPSGFRSLLNWIKDNYNNPQIIITENGLGDSGGTDDHDRVEYYQEFLSALLQAIIEDQVNVTGYTAWSLMDNFEWFDGYTVKYGLYSVDFDDANRTRTPKLSANYYTHVLSTRCLLTNGTCINE